MHPARSSDRRQRRPQRVRRRRLANAAAAVLAVLSPLAASAAETTAFVGATVMPVAGPPVEDGVLVIRDGTIQAVGARGEVDIPADAATVDVSGRVIIPGLVDTHSHIGEVAGADASGPIQPEARVLDSINVRDTGFERARAGGITSANLMAGSGHLLSGQTLYVKLREGDTVESIAYRNEDGSPAGGIKMANGTNSRGEPPFPGTRAKSAALVRQKYVAAREYRDKVQRAKGDPEKMPERDLGLEALVEVLDGKRVVHHHTHRHDDILTVLRLRDEFGFRVVLHHLSDAALVAEELAAAGVPSSLILIDSPGGKIEAIKLGMDAAAVMERAGAEFALHTDDYVTDSRLFLRMAALGVRAGLSREAALESLTLAGARMLDLADRVGSLEPGKDADFVILSGDPFSVYTRVLETWVEGEKLFDLDDPEDRGIAEGGYGVLAPSTVHTFHGYGEGHR
jgi:imidazolonepropionase-like amidohydrolase